VSQENLEAARRVWELFSEGAGSETPASDTVWSDLASPELEYREDPQWPGSGVYRGQEAIQARFEEYHEILGPTEVTLRDIKARGDVVVVVFDTHGNSRETDLPFEHEWAYVWTFNKGRLTEWQAYYATDAALTPASSPRLDGRSGR
jgi:ketosteroid isomerase-like protein